MFQLGDYITLTNESIYKSKLGNTIGRIVAIRDTDYVIAFNVYKEGYPLHHCEIGSQDEYLEEYYEPFGNGYYLRLKSKIGLYLDEDDLELCELKKGNKRLFRR